MGWHGIVMVLLAIRYIYYPVVYAQMDQNISDDTLSDTSYNIDDEGSAVTAQEEEKLDKLSSILTKLLVVPWPNGESPLLYVEKTGPEYYHSNGIEYTDLVPIKRSKYYRKYPWKRQNNRYDAENRYLCQPSKEDVFRLLVALHEARQGNKGHVVNFCNRKRPASSIFTNIRFLGKRK